MLDYVGVLVTADSVRDGIHEALVADLVTKTDVEVIFKKTCNLTTVDAEAIYPYLIGRPFFPSMVRNMTSGPSYFFLVAGPDAHRRLREVKGVFRQSDGDIEATGLRYHYRSGTRQELLQRGYEGTELLDKLNEFRIHATDTFPETLDLVRFCVGSAWSQALEHFVHEGRRPILEAHFALLS